MKTLLLVSVVALLAGSALMFPAGNWNNLKNIIDLLNFTNTTLDEHNYVKKVASADCKDEFFCQVHHILQNITAFRANMVGERIVRNLESYLNDTKVDCLVVPDNKTDEVPMQDFLGSLTTCIRRRNLGRGTAPMKTG